MIIFSDLLDQFMRRIRASSSSVAIEIGMSREAVNNWRRGYSLPNKKSRDKVLACAKYLRLSETEKQAMLVAAGFSKDLTEPNDEPGDFWKKTFEKLNATKPYPILMFLTQAHVDQPPHREHIKSFINDNLKDEEIIPLNVMYSESASIGEYFRFLGAQLNNDVIEDDLSFEFAMNDLLAKKKITLLICRFDQGNRDASDKLAGILRNLIEMHPGQLKILICGAEHLSELKYANGDLSLLNIASSHLLEVDVEAKLFQKLSNQFSSLEIEKAVKTIMEISGAHPILANELCDFIIKNKEFDKKSLNEIIMQSDLLYCDFNRVMKSSDTQKLKSYLEKSSLGPHRPYINDLTLRKLFWANLIKKSEENQLVWRSSAIKEFGLLMFKEMHN